MIFFHRRCIARSASNYVEIESFFIKKYYGLKSFIKKDNVTPLDLFYFGVQKKDYTLKGN